MKEAIEDYQRAATTITTRSIDQEFEPPALTFCSNPPFKPSKSEKYQLDFPARDSILIIMMVYRQKWAREWYNCMSVHIIFYSVYTVVKKRRLGLSNQVFRPRNWPPCIDFWALDQKKKLEVWWMLGIYHFCPVYVLGARFLERYGEVLSKNPL